MYIANGIHAKVQLYMLATSRIFTCVTFDSSYLEMEVIRVALMSFDIVLMKSYLKLRSFKFESCNLFILKLYLKFSNSNPK